MTTFIKIFLALLFTCTLSFLMVAWFMPKLQYSLSFTVNKPPDQVYYALIDSSALKNWMSSLKYYEISGEVGKIQTKIKLTFDENGEEVSVHEEILAVEPNRYFRFSIDNEVLSGFGEFRLEPKDSATLVTYKNDTQGKNLFWRSMLAIFRTTIEEKNQTDFEKLKVYIEKK